MKRLSGGKDMKNKRLVLASGSPRRRELLGMLDVEFEVRVPEGVEETVPEGMAVGEVAEFLARKKASGYVETMFREGDLVIAADTVVICEGEVMGKPSDAEAAEMMLRKLSGREHEVVSGVAVTDGVRTESFSVTTKVEFAELSREEIEHYVKNYKPFDKAGAYGIQEWIGAIGVRRIDGSFYNVMGLPVHRLYCVLKEWEA